MGGYGVEVVFDEKHDGDFPESRHVHNFVYDSLIDRPVTQKGNGEIVSAVHARGPGGADGTGHPAGDEPPMGFDFATTALSGVKLINAQRRNQELPPGSIVDKEGEPSTHPDDFLQGGGCLPFGGHKGYALMLASEFLGRIFSGADAFADPQHGGATMRHQGVCMIVFKADLFQPFSDYAGRADDMGQRVRAVQPAPGFEEVLVPGDLEVRSRAERERHGIPIHEDVWQSLVQAAGSVGVQVD